MPEHPVPGLRHRLSRKDLDEILERHRRQLDSGSRSNDGDRADLKGINLSGADLSAVNLHGADLSKAYLRRCNLRGANLSYADLSHSNLNRSDLEGANLLNAHLEGASLKLARLHRVDLQGANLSHANLNLAELRTAYLFETRLREAQLNGASLRNAKLNHADLGAASLVRADMQEACFFRTNFQLADLLEAKLWSSNLQEADFRGASLKRANFECRTAAPAGDASAVAVAGMSTTTDLTNARLQHSDLSDAKLAHVCGLQSFQLAGADLSNARLPDDIKGFKGLDHVGEISKLSRTIFVTLISSCVFCWLTIATTTDSALLASSATTPLPIIQTKVPIAGFYLAAPAALLALYFYLHMYLQNLWEGLANLPAIFPDGQTVDQRAYPWLLTSLVRVYVPRLKKHRPTFAAAKVGCSVISAWGLVPFTLVLFWFRYLPRHESIGSALLTAFVLTAIWSGTVFFDRAATALRGVLPVIAPKTRVPGVATASAVLVIGAVWALTAVAEKRSSLELLGYRLYAELQDADVSIRPASWTGSGNKEAIDAQIAQVRGASLAGADLRLAFAPGAFFVKANLEAATLTGADLSDAKLTNANLREAKLAGSDLTGADLAGADLTGADLAGADLRGAVFWRKELHGSEIPAARDDACRRLSKAINLHKALRDGSVACGVKVPESGQVR